MRRYIFVLIFGLGGFAVLANLSLWQLRRLAVSNDRIAAITAQMQDPPQALPETPVPDTHRYLGVTAAGVIGDKEFHVLTATPRGAAYRIVVPFQTGDRLILLDRGLVPEADRTAARYTGPVTATGNLDWPREVDGFTPDPDLETGLWFAREVPAMAEVWGTEPVMIVASQPTGTPSPKPMPVTPRAKVNHLSYAITWALMGAVWLAMTGLLVLRIRRNKT
ncbi:SURF1 family protein [Halovulum sp. GXIMD14793]